MRLVDRNLVIAVDSGALLVAVVIGEYTVPYKDLFSLNADRSSLLTTLVAVSLLRKEK